MRTTLSVERIDVGLDGSFSETTALFEQKVPRADLSRFAQLVTSEATPQQVEDTVRNMAGDLEFMVLARIDAGPLVSRLGRPKKMTVFLIGNPAIANRMYEEDPATGLYAPLRVELYEDYGGRVHFTYDLPSSLLRQFHNVKIDQVAELLDAKLLALAASLHGRVHQEVKAAV
jgi:uncharacterized protein (DUF302 family)